MQSNLHVRFASLALCPLYAADLALDSLPLATFARAARYEAHDEDQDVGHHHADLSPDLDAPELRIERDNK